MVTRGEVWWAEHPVWGRRPVLLMTRNEAIEQLSEIFVMLATTTIRGLGTEVELGPEDGMPRTCVLNADQTDTLARGFLIERITKLGPEKMHEICGALDIATGCGTG